MQGAFHAGGVYGQDCGKAAGNGFHSRSRDGEEVKTNAGRKGP